MRRASFALIAILLLPLTLNAAELVNLNGAAEPLSVDLVESGAARTVIEYEINAFTKAAIERRGPPEGMPAVHASACYLLTSLRSYGIISARTGVESRSGLLHLVAWAYIGV